MSQIILYCTCFSSDQQAYTLYYNHFDDPSNLIGSQQCGLFTNRTIFFFFCALNHIIFVRNRTNFALYRIISVAPDIKALLLPRFNKPTTRSV